MKKEVLARKNVLNLSVYFLLMITSVNILISIIIEQIKNNERDLISIIILSIITIISISLFIYSLLKRNIVFCDNRKLYIKDMFFNKDILKKDFIKVEKNNTKRNSITFIYYSEDHLDTYEFTLLNIANLDETIENINSWRKH